MANDATSITIIRHPVHHHGDTGTKIAISADRWQLAKLRWRTSAADGKDFGFELEQPLHHGDVVCVTQNACYIIEQIPEPVLVFPIQSVKEAATLAWSIGNLHQPVQALDAEIVAVDDPAVRQWCEQQHVTYRVEERIFEPLRTAAGHHHHHHQH